MSGAPVISAGSLIGVVSVTDVLEFEEGNPGVPRLREGATDDTEWAGGEDEENLPADFFTEGWAPSAADTLQRIRSSDSPEWDALDEAHRGRDHDAEGDRPPVDGDRERGGEADGEAWNPPGVGDR